MGIPMDTKPKLTLRNTLTWRPGHHMKALCIFNLGRVSTGIYFVTLRKLIFSEISFYEINFVELNFRKFHSLLATRRKLFPVKFVLFFPSRK